MRLQDQKPHLYMSFWHDLSVIFNTPELDTPLYGLLGGGIDTAGVLAEVEDGFFNQ